MRGSSALGMAATSASISSTPAAAVALPGAGEATPAASFAFDSSVGQAEDAENVPLSAASQGMKTITHYFTKMNAHSSQSQSQSDSQSQSLVHLRGPRQRLGGVDGLHTVSTPAVEGWWWCSVGFGGEIGRAHV